MGLEAPFVRRRRLSHLQGQTEGDLEPEYHPEGSLYSGVMDNKSFATHDYGYSTAVKGPPGVDRIHSTLSNESEVLDPDDPRVTGVNPQPPTGEEIGDIEKNLLRQMDYRTRRKYLQRSKIEFNMTGTPQTYISNFCHLNITTTINLALRFRQRFLLKLARALMTFGAPSHRIESQLTAAARILEVHADFIHLPGVIICSFGERSTGGSQTHFVKSTGRLALGLLHKVHQVYRSVVHDEISAKQAIVRLDELMKEAPIYPWWLRCIFAFWLSCLICPLAFGGSLVDMWFAGVGAFVLAFLQLHVAHKSTLYANVFEYGFLLSRIHTEANHASNSLGLPCQSLSPLLLEV